MLQEHKTYLIRVFVQKIVEEQYKNENSPYYGWRLSKKKKKKKWGVNSSLITEFGNKLFVKEDRSLWFLLTKKKRWWKIRTIIWVIIMNYEIEKGK